MRAKLENKVLKDKLRRTRVDTDRGKIVTGLIEGAKKRHRAHKKRVLEENKKRKRNYERIKFI